MIELGQLERRHEDFARRNARVLAVSMDGLEDSQKAQARFPHVLILSDTEEGLSKAAGVVHSGASPEGNDADMPTTILVDRRGIVRWLYRPPAVLERLSPEEVLSAIDANMPSQ